MNRKSNLLAALAMAAALCLGGCASQASAGAGPPSSPAPTGVTMSGTMATSGDAMVSMIHIENAAYRDPVPVSPGTTVTVMNMDAVRYSVSADDGKSFSVSVPAGGMVTFTAPMKPGNYPFHSEGNNTMHGLLMVK